MNITAFTGNIGADAEVKNIREGLDVVNFSVAVTNRVKEGEPKTTWFKCVWFLKPDNKAIGFLKKGNVVAVVGEVDMEKFNDKEGVERANLKLNVTEVTFCYIKPSNENPE